MKTKLYCCNECKKITPHNLKFINQTPEFQAGARIVYFSLQCSAIDCIKIRTSHMSIELWDKLPEIPETP